MKTEAIIHKDPHFWFMMRGDNSGRFRLDSSLNHRRSGFDPSSLEGMICVLVINRHRGHDSITDYDDSSSSSITLRPEKQVTERTTDVVKTVFCWCIFCYFPSRLFLFSIFIALLEKGILQLIFMPLDWKSLLDFWCCCAAVIVSQTSCGEITTSANRFLLSINPNDQTETFASILHQ